MAVLNLIVELDSEEGMEQVAQDLQERIGRLDAVEEVDAVPLAAADIRFGVIELAAAIGVTVVLVRQSRELLEELPKFMAALRALIPNSNQIKNVYVDVGNERVRIDQLSDEQLSRLTVKR